MSPSQISDFFSSVPPNSTVIVQDRVPQLGWNNSRNAQVRDWRKGADYLQIARYGIACDATRWYVTLKAGSNQVEVGSDFGVEGVGKTFAFGLQTGRGYHAAQYAWEPTVVAYHYPVATLSGNAPFNFTGFASFGTLNTSALQAAFNDAGYAFPLRIPTGCFMLTGPVSWSAATSVLGQQMGQGGFVGLPGQDIFQQPDAPGAGSANANGLRLEDFSLDLNSTIDWSLGYTQYDPSGKVATTVAPVYRPLLNHSQVANNPLAAGWVSGGRNGVASITQDSAVICVPAALGRVPAVEQTIVFPYLPSVFLATVVSNTGSGCAKGFAGSTLSTAFPGGTGYTVAQAYWEAGTAFTTLETAIPATMAYPFKIKVSLPTAPQPSSISNVAPHGHIKIGSTEFDYMGNNYSPSAGAGELVLQRGPATTPGYSAGSQPVVPLNPCAADFETPYPVIPSINSNDATPPGAVFFPGECAGNAALAFPQVNGHVHPGVGLVNSFLSRLQFNVTAAQGTNGTTALYQAGNAAGYSVDYRDFKVNYLEFGIAQGPASSAQWGVAAVGPTGTGNSIENCEIRAAYPLILVDYQQGKIDRCDTYTQGTSPYDGKAIGAVTAGFLGYTLNEQTGGVVTNTSQVTVQDWNAEPENGSHIEIPVYFESDCYSCNFKQDNFEGGFTLWGGGAQLVENGQMSNPVINYGFNNRFENLTGLNTGYITNLWDGSQQFLNWGTRSSCSSYAGGQGPLTQCGAGFDQSYNGHSGESSEWGMGLKPFENSLGGMIVPGEWNTAGNLDVSPMQVGYAVDSTEPFWGSYAACNLGGGAQCQPGHFDGFNGYIYIGSHNRIAPGPYVLEANFKSAKADSQFTMYLAAFDSGSGQCGRRAGILTNVTIHTTTAWQHSSIPVDFTDKQGCVLALQFYNGSTADQLRVGEFNFMPLPQRVLAPIVTLTEGAACPVAGAWLGSDGTNLWYCAGSAAGPGRVKHVPLL